MLNHRVGQLTIPNLTSARATSTTPRPTAGMVVGEQCLHRHAEDGTGRHLTRQRSRDHSTQRAGGRRIVQPPWPQSRNYAHGCRATDNKDTPPEFARFGPGACSKRAGYLRSDEHRRRQAVCLRKPAACVETCRACTRRASGALTEPLGRQLTDTMVEHRSRLPSLLLGRWGWRGQQGCRGVIGGNSCPARMGLLFTRPSPASSAAAISKVAVKPAAPPPRPIGVCKPYSIRLSSIPFGTPATFGMPCYPHNGHTIR